MSSLSAAQVPTLDQIEVERQRRRRIWTPLLHQIPPPADGTWDTWLLLGGRGSGKTEAGARYVLDHLRQYGRRARVGVGAPTIADVRDICAEGESGLITIAPGEFRYNRSLGEARHVAGGYVKFLGAEQPGRWNGPQWSLLWADELALWIEESWHQAQFGLRLGSRPRAVATTTPKNRHFVRELAALSGTVVSRASMRDNPHLAESAVRKLQARYGGTLLGRQELEAEWVDEVPGALWTHAMIGAHRVHDAPSLVRVVVAIDPAATSGEEADETGIIVAGKGTNGHGYVLADRTCRLSPAGWAARAVTAYHDFKADRIVAEVNNGGEMVEHTLRTVEGGRTVPYKAIHASRGKRARAEPVSALYEQGLVHHVGSFPQLEDQLCTYVPGQGTWSPDRHDALVWAVTELGILLAGPTVRWL